MWNTEAIKSTAKKDRFEKVTSGEVTGEISRSLVLFAEGQSCREIV
jgi:hypothetical protein